MERELWFHSLSSCVGLQFSVYNNRRNGQTPGLVVPRPEFWQGSSSQNPTLSQHQQTANPAQSSTMHTMPAITFILLIDWSVDWLVGWLVDGKVGNKPRFSTRSHCWIPPLFSQGYGLLHTLTRLSNCWLVIQQLSLRLLGNQAWDDWSNSLLERHSEQKKRTCQPRPFMDTEKWKRPIKPTRNEETNCQQTCSQNE